MKKFFLLAMAAVAMTFTACKNEPAAPVVEEEAPEVVEITTDSIAKVIEANDSTQLGALLQTVQDQIETLKGTDPAKAKEYLTTIQNFLKENAEKIKAVVGTGAVATLVDNVAKFELPDVVDAAKDIVEDAAKDVAEGAADLKDAAVDKANEAVDKAGEAVDKAKDAVGDAAANVKDAAVDKANEAVDAAADKLKGALK